MLDEDGLDISLRKVGGFLRQTYSRVNQEILCQETFVGKTFAFKICGMALSITILCFNYLQYKLFVRFASIAVHE